LTLINSSTPLPPDRLSVSVTMAELKDRGFSLSKKIFGKIVQGQEIYLLLVL